MASKTMYNAYPKHEVEQSCLVHSLPATGRVRPVGCRRGYCTRYPDPRPPAAHARNTNKRSRCHEQACTDVDAYSPPRTELLTRPSRAASPHAMPYLSSRPEFSTRPTINGGAPFLVPAGSSGSMSRACTGHGVWWSHRYAPLGRPREPAGAMHLSLYKTAGCETPTRERTLAYDTMHLVALPARGAGRRDELCPYEIHVSYQ